MPQVTGAFSYLDQHPPTHELVASFFGFKSQPRGEDFKAEHFTAEVASVGFHGQQIRKGKSMIPDFVRKSHQSTEPVN
jgi:hypothetical protein